MDHRLAAGLALAALCCVRPASAQGPPILPSTRVVQAGPASLYPAIALRNVGTDSNVYNDGTGARGDFTYSVTPRLYAVVPIGGTRFIGTGTGDFVDYRTYKDQRSLNAFLEGRYDVVDARIRPFVAAGFATHRERQGHEIDARARQTQTTMTVGAEFALTPITSLTGWARRETTWWDRDEHYSGYSLAEQLNFSSDILAAGARFRLTPFTSIVAVAEVQRDRFEHSPERDADSVRIAPTLEFDNGGAITGQARVGYRAFRPRNPALDGYGGLTASVGVNYEFLDLARVRVDAIRDVRSSYYALQPYYLETGLGFKANQRIVGPFEIVALGERWQLRNQRLGGTSFDGRRDNITMLGGGVAFRLREQTEIAVTLDRTIRTSSESNGRNYQRHRVLASVSYGV